MKLLFKLVTVVSVSMLSVSAAPMSDQEKEDAFFARYDVDQNNRITRDEMPPFLRMKFNAFDYNHNGSITRGELRRSAREKRNRQIYNNRRNNYFKNFSFNHFDRNRDGLIVKGEMSNKLKRSYRSYDQNGDGMLNKKEYRNLRAGRVIQPRKQKHYTRRGTPGTFYYLDLNRDGYISKSEMTSDLKNQFYAFDMNGDNKISRSEFQSSKREQNQQGGGYGYDSQQGGGMQQDYGERFEKKDAYDEILNKSNSDLY